MRPRSLLAAAGLLAIATTALAQPQVQVKLTEASVPGSGTGQGGVAWNGVYVSPYTGVVTQTGQPNKTVILNCVDYFHHVSLNQTWTAYKSVLYVGADLSKTRFNNAELYLQAAYLTWQQPTQPSLNTTTQQTTIAIQTAIWNILTPSAPDKSGGSMQTSQSWWMSQAALEANWKSANTGQFYLLTAINKSDPNSVQEFVVYDPTAPVLTPEPATLTLLGTGIAGVAGWARRRRRKRIAEGAAA